MFIGLEMPILHGYEVEREVAAIFRSLGAEVQPNVALAGNQVDGLVVERTASGATITSAVEVKAYSRPVGLQIVNAFAATALLLAAVGLYGLMSYSVIQRYHEIGVRLALGAGRGQVVGSIIAQGAELAAAGLVIGLAVSFPITRVLESALFGVTAQDTVSFIAVAALLVVVAFIATCIPARRAVRVDPLVVLR